MDSTIPTNYRGETDCNLVIAVEAFAR